MHYPFQRDSSAIVQWRRGVPPMPTRAADNVSLGSVTIIPGGPEPIQGIFDTMPWWQMAGLAFVAGYLARGLLR